MVNRRDNKAKPQTCTALLTRWITKLQKKGLREFERKRRNWQGLNFIMEYGIKQAAAALFLADIVRPHTCRTLSCRACHTFASRTYPLCREPDRFCSVAGRGISVLSVGVSGVALHHPSTTPANSARPF